MNEFAESLWRLYNERHLITEEKVTELFENGKITQQQYDCIMGA